MSNKAYQDIPALSHSLIVACRDKGMLPAWRNSPFNPERESVLPTDALEQGQLYHCLIHHPEVIERMEECMTESVICLNPSAKTPKDETLYQISIDDTTIIYVFPFGKMRTTQKYQDLRDYLAAFNMWVDDGIICTKEELDAVVQRLQFLFVHPIYQVLSQYKQIGAEIKVEFQLDGNPCKAELDAVYQMPNGKYLVVDWKTTRYSTRQGIQVCGEKLGYHIQDYIYRNAAAQHFGVSVNDIEMCFVFQNKDYPEMVYRAVFGLESYAQGESDYAQYGRDFMARVENSKTMGFVAFMDVCGELEFTHTPNRYIEQPEEFGL